MFSEKNFSQGKGSVPLKPMYAMADPALDLTLEKSDPKGLYRLEATVKDNISNESISNFYEFTLIEK
jgi:hypothetical protein